jgi:putative toxin-antitoxin system antitoxin component (TIGR02293 family)
MARTTETLRPTSAGSGESREQGGPDLTDELRRFRNLLMHGRLGTHDYAVFLGFFDVDLFELVGEVTRGIPYRAFERLRRNTSWQADILASLLDIPQRTLARRKREGRFHPDESDRLLRVSRIFGRAVQLFEGDSKEASAWLERPLPALGNKRPIDLARTEVGALEVERVILALEHGVFV